MHGLMQARPMHRNGYNTGVARTPNILFIFMVVFWTALIECAFAWCSLHRYSHVIAAVDKSTLRSIFFRFVPLLTWA